MSYRAFAGLWVCVMRSSQRVGAAASRRRSLRRLDPAVASTALMASPALRLFLFSIACLVE